MADEPSAADAPPNERTMLIRRVPGWAVEAIRAAGRRQRRSLNAQVVQVLVEYAEREALSGDGVSGKE